MRRKVWFRSLATLLAVWLPLVAGEPGLLQPCPMHGAERAVIASLRGEPIQPGMVGGTEVQPRTHSHHGSTTMMAQNDQSAPSSHHASHTCSCIDGCATGAITCLAPPAPTAELLVAAYGAASSVPSVETLARPAPEFSRPYTTGPPRA